MAAAGWEEGQPAPWSRFETILEGAINVGYDGDSNSSSNFSVTRDLTMKNKITYNTWDNCNGWYVKTKKGGYWYRNQHPDSQVDAFLIHGDLMWYTSERHELTSHSYEIPKEMRSTNKCLNWSVQGNVGEDAKTCWMGLSNVYLYSQPILVQLGA